MGKCVDRFNSFCPAKQQDVEALRWHYFSGKLAYFDFLLLLLLTVWLEMNSIEFNWGTLILTR